MTITLELTRYFTPEEATALLPEILVHVNAIKDDLAHLKTIVQEAPDHLEFEEQEEIREMILGIERTLADRMEHIEAIGVQIKGTTPVLLDFPALHNGQEVVLCWREGEEDVVWWHPTHTGIRGRQQVDLDKLGCWEWCN